MNKRPTRNDESVIESVAKELAPKVLLWLQEESTTESLSEVTRDLINALKFNDDGYDIARALERGGGYSPDSSLVDELDSAYWLKIKALEELEIAWVKESQTAEIPLETTVVWCQKKDAGSGIVTRNHPNGKSTVMFPGLGHIREGIGSHGFICPWEELTTV